jgi:hypothetical protein
MIVVGPELRRDTEVRQQTAGVTRVLGGDQVHLREHAAGSIGNILEIADGCCHHV